MDSKRLFSCIFHIMLCLYICIWSSYISFNCEANIFNDPAISPTSNEAVGSNQDFVGEWKRACESSGGVFRIPPGTYSLGGSTTFQGPCNGKTTVTIEGVLRASSETTLPTGYWIGFENVDGLTINGKGTLDGNGASAWGRTNQAPTSLNFEKVSNAQIQDITLSNSKMFHIKLDNSQHVTFYHVRISSPGNSPNTDGIHIGRSSDIRISNSFIASGDDCVSIGDGSSNINITGVFCGPGHGFSIGSLGKYQGEKDVSLVTVTNCTLKNTLDGVRIKTVAPSVPVNVNTVTFQHIILDNVYNPIIIDQNYCPRGQCPKGDSSVQIKGVKFIDVRGSSGMPVGVKLDCSRSRPCQDIQLSGVNIKFNGQPTRAECYNANAMFVGGGQVPSKC